jgi:hypothetical protein
MWIWSKTRQQHVDFGKTILGAFSCLELDDLFHPKLEKTTKVPTVFATMAVCVVGNDDHVDLMQTNTVFDCEDEIGPLLPGPEKRSVWGVPMKVAPKTRKKRDNDQAQLLFATTDIATIVWILEQNKTAPLKLKTNLGHSRGELEDQL